MTGWRSESEWCTIRLVPLDGRSRRRANPSESIRRSGIGSGLVHDYGISPDSRPFLPMKLIKGRTLEDPPQS